MVARRQNSYFQQVAEPGMTALFPLAQARAVDRPEIEDGRVVGRTVGVARPSAAAVQRAAGAAERVVQRKEARPLPAVPLPVVRLPAVPLPVAPSPVTPAVARLVPGGGPHAETLAVASQTSTSAEQSQPETTQPAPPPRNSAAEPPAAFPSAPALVWGEPVVPAARRQDFPDFVPPAAATLAGKLAAHVPAAAAGTISREVPAFPANSSGPSITIGHIEVRSSAAPAAVPAPVGVAPPAPRAAPAAAAPLVSRGYGWRFGLNQG